MLKELKRTVGTGKVFKHYTNKSAKAIFMKI